MGLNEGINRDYQIDKNEKLDENKIVSFDFFNFDVDAKTRLENGLVKEIIDEKLGFEFADGYRQEDLEMYIEEIEDMEKYLSGKIIKDYDIYDSGDGFMFGGEISFEVDNINHFISEGKMKIDQRGRIEVKNKEGEWISFDNM